MQSLTPHTHRPPNLAIQAAILLRLAETSHDPIEQAWAQARLDSLKRPSS